MVSTIPVKGISAIKQVDEVIRGERFAEGQKQADDPDVLNPPETVPGRVVRRPGGSQGLGKGDGEKGPVKFEC